MINEDSPTQRRRRIFRKISLRFTPIPLPKGNYEETHSRDYRVLKNIINHNNFFSILLLLR